MVRRLFLWCVVLFVLAAAAVHRVWTTPLLSASDPPLTLEVPSGATEHAIAQRLVSMDLIVHPWLFRAAVRWRGAEGRLRAGRYTLIAEMTLDDVVALLQKGIAERHDITIPEGRSIEQVAIIGGRRGIPADRIVEFARDPTPIFDLDPEAEDLEGYLFPDTYDVPLRDDPARTLVEAMVSRFRERVADLSEEIAASEMSLREIVTLASLVELETADGSERPRIAAVFLNRLGRGMRLQTDPTVIYALRRRGGYDGNIRKGDLDIDSPYNTYRYSGLPPGPIASPGRQAILAVLHPAQTDELYFVSRNDGTHHFSRTLSEHERAVDRYQRRRRRAPPSTASPTG